MNWQTNATQKVIVSNDQIRTVDCVRTQAEVIAIRRIPKVPRPFLQKLLVATAAAFSRILAASGQDASHLKVLPVPFGLFTPAKSDDSITINASFSGDGSSVYFSKSHAGWAGLTIFQSHLNNGEWSEPTVATFSGLFKDTDPAVTPDGKFIIFASMRDKKGLPASSYSLFKASSSFSGERDVVALGDAVNDGASELYPSIARDGTLYFMRNKGTVTRIVRAELKNGEYANSEVQQIPGDSDGIFDSDPTIAPDQSYIVFSSNRSDSLGSNDLYVSFRRNKKWCNPIHLDAPVNSSDPEIATGLSPDGRRLYFASTRNKLTQPRLKRTTAADFRTEMVGYENGRLRTYQVDIGAWLDAHKPPEGSCGVQ